MLRRYEAFWLAVGMLASVVIAVVASISASNRALRDSEQRSCGSLLAEIRVYQESPPTTAAGRGLQRAKLEQYRIQKCPEGKTP